MPVTHNYGARPQPEWYGPPPMVGGYVTGPLLISQSERVVVVVRQVLAFPSGVTIEVEGHARGSLHAGPTREIHDPAGHSSLRFEIQFADGRQAAQDDEAGLQNGRGPTLFERGSESSSGGPEGGEDVRMTLWMWPLPPPGPVTLVCSWPSQGLDAARAVLDATTIGEAADRAQPFWPAREP